MRFRNNRSVVVPPWGAEYDHKSPITHTASVSMTNLRVQYGLWVYKRASEFNTVSGPVRNLRIQDHPRVDQGPSGLTDLRI